MGRAEFESSLSSPLELGRPSTPARALSAARRQAAGAALEPANPHDTAPSSTLTSTLTLNLTSTLTSSLCADDFTEKTAKAYADRSKSSDRSGKMNEGVRVGGGDSVGAIEDSQKDGVRGGDRSGQVVGLSQASDGGSGGSVDAWRGLWADPADAGIVGGGFGLGDGGPAGLTHFLDTPLPFANLLLDEVYSPPKDV